MSPKPKELIARTSKVVELFETQRNAKGYPKRRTQLKVNIYKNLRNEVLIIEAIIAVFRLCARS